MKPIFQAAASAVASVVASILATWLLRRIVYSAASTGTEGPGGRQVPPVVIIPTVVVIGNTIGSQLMPERPRGPLAMVRRGRH